MLSAKHAIFKPTRGSTDRGNPGIVGFGTPGARKRARPVWGGLGGNVRQQCRNAPPFHSITGAVRRSKCFATMASASGSLHEGYQKVVFAGGRPAQTRHCTRSKRNNFPFCSTTACPSRRALLPPGANSRSLILRPRAFLPPTPGNSTANIGADCAAHPIYSG